MKFRKSTSENQLIYQVPEVLIKALQSLDVESLVLIPGEEILFQSQGVSNFGLIKDDRITSEDLLALIRVVRRTRESHRGTLELARGPIGAGKRELKVSVAPLDDEGMVLVLISDESEAQRVHEVRRDFVANISHELKTPIGALSLLSEAVLGAKDEPEAVTMFATRMQSESKRLTDLVQEIINLSRIQDSDPLQVAEEVEVGFLVKEAIDQSQINAENRNITVTFQEEKNLSVWGDRDQLTMATQNLIENAINYSSEKTRVTISTKLDSQIIEILVKDQGIGIADENLDRIFERFYRVDPARSRATGGTGLGLSIVKHVVKNHGGEVKVWSAPGVGSTFAIRLPVTKEKSSK